MSNRYARKHLTDDYSLAFPAKVFTRHLQCNDMIDLLVKPDRDARAFIGETLIEICEGEPFSNRFVEEVSRLDLSNHDGS